MAPSASPSSPSASPAISSPFLQKLFTGVTPTDPETHYRRWHPSAVNAPTPSSPKSGSSPAALAKASPARPGAAAGRVASLVNSYEEASLGLKGSKPYSALPYSTSPPTPLSAPLSPSSSRFQSPPPASQQQQLATSTNAIPAKFFQQQQPRGNTPSSPASSFFFSSSTNGSEKENSRPPPPISSRPYNTPSTTDTQLPKSLLHTAPSPSNSTVSSTSLAPTSTSTNSSSLETHENAFIGFAQPVAVPAFEVAPAPPTRSNFLDNAGWRDEVVPVVFEKEVVERLPFPRSARGKDLATTNNAGGGGRPARPRASTLGAVGKSASLENARPFLMDARTEEDSIEVQFEDMLDSLQLPKGSSTRLKMQSLPLALKQQMLSNHLSSSSSRPASSQSRTVVGGGHKRGSSTSTTLSSSSTTSNKKDKSPISTFSKSFASALVAPLKKSKSSQSLKSIGGTSGSGSGTGERERERLGEEEDGDAVWWAVRVRSCRRENLNPKLVARLRGRLRGEKIGWVTQFIQKGGGKGLVDRLDEVLSVEWREEQHDDQLLLELLKCFLALTLSLSGISYLRSIFPHPFISLATLLFSQKRPGELDCRRVMIELVSSLWIVLPSYGSKSLGVVSTEDWRKSIGAELGEEDEIVDVSSGSGNGSRSGGRRYTRPVKSGDEDEIDLDGWELVLKDEEKARREKEVHAFVWSLMMGPPKFADEKKVGFIRNAWKERVFKSWVGELADLVRDYFWIFCHEKNQFWEYGRLDAEEIARPRVPNGMTGGVESEAMDYAATHLRLINKLAGNCPSDQVASELHVALFSSGFERILMVLRRASTTYYPHLHLELAQYIFLARKARFNLGPRILGALKVEWLTKEERVVVKAWAGGSPQIGLVV